MKKMYVLIIIVIACILIKIYCFPDDLGSALMKAHKQYVKQEISFYKKMKNCHFYNSDKFGVLNSVSGRNKDGSCSVTINNYNCKFPADVYADFAKKNITVKTYMLKNTGKNNKENEQINEIIRSLTSMTDPYCSINPRFYPERQGVKYHKLGDAECEVRINQYGNSYSCQGSNTNYAMEEIKRMYEKQKDFSVRRVRYGRI